MLLMRLVLTLVCLVGLSSAFYLPGVAPTNYKKGDPIPLLVNHLTPSNTHQVQDHRHKLNSKTYIYSYDYYYPRFKFCQPKDGPKKQLESLGAIIFGDRIFNSPFDIKMLEDVSCEQLCESSYSKSDAKFVNRNIRAGYKYNWLIDGLPAAKPIIDQRTHASFYGLGFDIGELGGDEPIKLAYLHNHFDIRIEYHKRKDDVYRVVGVLVEPKSLERSGMDPSSEDFCTDKQKKVALSLDDNTKVFFTYSVKFVESDTAWATRWDKYLYVYDPKIQWFSLINFSIVVFILGLIIAHILVKTLRNDIIKYNEVNLDDDITDESGWKLVHSDVFRAPEHSMVLSILVGSGVQVLLMGFVTIVFALLGLLSPSNRGALSTFMFMAYIGLSFISAFVSSYLYKLFGGDNWKRNMILTPLAVPGGLFATFVFLNFFLIFVNSSGAIPIGTMCAIVVIWFAISIPLSVFGSILGSKRPLLTAPVRTNQIPRQIPDQPWYLKTFPSMVISGIFPFGSIAVEMYFIYTSLWFNRIYYMFGFLFFCFLLMAAITALISILMVYYSLCAENYKWQWRSLYVGGGCSLFVLLHSLLLTRGQHLGGFPSIVLFVGYSAVISFLLFLCCCPIGFFSCFLFVRKIYSQIKID